MSIKPIDLQTLFAKLDEVSKEQLLAKEQASLQQAQAAKSQVAKEIQQDHSVVETPEDSEVSKVKDDEEKKSGRRKQPQKGSKTQNSDEEGREVIQDPDVGRHVDLSG